MQVIGPLLLTEIFGGLMKHSTSAEAELEQPLVVFVTVRMYVPQSFTVGVRVVAPDTIFPSVVVQRYVKLGPCEEPFPLSVVCVLVQVMLPFELATADGAVVFWVTLTVITLVQPFASEAVTL